jgi:hypothetical protein
VPTPAFLAPGRGSAGAGTGGTQLGTGYAKLKSGLASIQTVANSGLGVKGILVRY